MSQPLDSAGHSIVLCHVLASLSVRIVCLADTLHSGAMESALFVSAGKPAFADSARLTSKSVLSRALFFMRDALCAAHGARCGGNALIVPSSLAGFYIAPTSTQNSS